MIERLAWVFSAVAVAACASSSSPIQSSAKVRYVAVSTTCGSIVPVAFSIDGQVVGTDTFRMGVGPAAEHVVSSDFATTTGRHVIGARVTFTSGTVAWPDTSIELAAGAVFVDSMPFYCS